ncbi:hypothetical protein EDB19DRAFT_1763871 [Suillus lakei]|nr:hypothetical protein EDB19DRAFT_1763871 [Suillus lakei]
MTCRPLIIHVFLLGELSSSNCYTMLSRVSLGTKDFSGHPQAGSVPAPTEHPSHKKTCWHRSTQRLRSSRTHLKFTS